MTLREHQRYYQPTHELSNEDQSFRSHTQSKVAKQSHEVPTPTSIIKQRSYEEIGRQKRGSRLRLMLTAHSKEVEPSSSVEEQESSVKVGPRYALLILLIFCLIRINLQQQ